MPTLQIIIIVAFSLLVLYVAISRYIKFKNKNKEPKNIVFNHVPIDYSVGTREYEILKILNAELYRRGYRQLKSDAMVTAKAWSRTREMDKSGIIDHSEAKDELLELKIDGSDGSADLISKYYNTPLTVIGKEPVIDASGKVIKKGYGFFGSPDHKKAILNKKYDYCGINSLKRASGRWIDVLMLVDEKTVN